MKPDFEKDNKSGINHEGPNANWPVKFLTATSLVGDKIETKNGEHIGEIKDIMLNILEGNVEYVVVEIGGFLGIGEKLFAIPFKALNIHRGKRSFVLDRDKAYLEKAPGFDKHHWPETNAHLNSVDSYWGDFMRSSTGGSI